MSAETRVEVRGLELEAVVGCLRAERAAPQPLRVDLSLTLREDAAAWSEQVEQALDYTRMAEAAALVLGWGRFLLLESAATCLARCLLALAWPLGGATRAEVGIAKPRALRQGLACVRRVEPGLDLSPPGPRRLYEGARVSAALFWEPPPADWCGPEAAALRPWPALPDASLILRAPQRDGPETLALLRPGM